MSAFGHYSCSLDGSKSQSQNLGAYKKRDVTNRQYDTIPVLTKTGKLKGGETTGNPWVAAFAKEGHWDGYGQAQVRQDPIKSKKMDWDIYAEAGQNAAGVAGRAKGNAKVHDPWLIEWYSPGPWTISAGYELLPGTALNLSGNSDASGFEVSSSSDFLSQWYLDFDIDGTPDQLFWSLNINMQSSASSFTSAVNLVLGPDVFLDNGKTEQQIESELLSHFDGSGSFSLTSAYNIPATYNVGTLGAGSLIISGSDFAEAQVAGGASTVPEPPSIGLLLLGIMGIVFLPRRGKAA